MAVGKGRLAGKGGVDLHITQSLLQLPHLLIALRQRPRLPVLVLRGALVPLKLGHHIGVLPVRLCPIHQKSGEGGGEGRRTSYLLPVKLEQLLHPDVSERANRGVARRIPHVARFERPQPIRHGWQSHRSGVLCF